MTESSPSSSPAGTEAVTLRGDGLGVVSFGQERTNVLATLTERFGPAAAERGDSGECPLDPLDQTVYFDQVTVGFRDEVFSYYSTGDDTYATPEGVGPGSTVGELEDAFGSDLTIDNQAETMGPLYRMQTETGEVRGQFGDVVSGETRGLVHLSAGPGCI